MATIQRDSAAYRVRLRMSNRKHLLVEGRDDKRLFEYLLSEFLGESHGISIDSVEDHIKHGKINNRDEVEAICRSVEDESYAEKLVGFVDREYRQFRGFEFGEIIADEISGHRVDGRLVWSRGHSIENYFFDFDILRRAFSIAARTDSFDEVLTLFKNTLQATICVACAVGLAGQDMHNIQIGRIRDSVDGKHLEVTSSTVMLKLDVWRQALLAKKVSIQDADTLVERFQFWHARVTTTDFAIVRWLCDGHIGLRCMWMVYLRCVSIVVKHEAPKASSVSKQFRFNAYASFWAQQAKINQCEYPHDVFRLFGLNVVAAP